MTAAPLRIVGLLALLSVAGGARAADSSPLTISQYQEQLRAYQASIQDLRTAPQHASDFYRTIPDGLVVHGTHGTVSVPTGFLRDGIVRFQTAAPKAKPGILLALGQRLDSMYEEAEAFEQPSRATDDIRARLDRILAGGEFSRVHGPAAWEVWRDRFYAWLDRLFKRMGPHMPAFTDVGQITIWVLMAVACAVLGVWLYRISRQRLAERPREIMPFAPSERSWRAWLAEAREKASQGLWREAIHSAFWAAVSRLEAEGLWRPDRARTPREYLHAIPPANPARTPFSTLTGTFERTWYGNRPGSEMEFSQFVTELEKLGCH
jgi:hypothetical protein